MEAVVLIALACAIPAAFCRGMVDIVAAGKSRSLRRTSRFSRKSKACAMKSGS